MKKEVRITIGRESYPCYPTMGAMLRYKDLSGKEVTEIGAHELSELGKYLWCCVASATHREGREFPLSVQDFADNVDLPTLKEWQKSITSDTEASEGGDEKKSL